MVQIPLRIVPQNNNALIQQLPEVIVHPSVLVMVKMTVFVVQVTTIAHLLKFVQTIPLLGYVILFLTVQQTEKIYVLVD